MSVWQEMGLAILLAGALWTWAAAPPEEVHIRDLAHHEGQRVTVFGWPEDVRQGDGWSRGILVHDGHGIPFHADTLPDTNGPIIVEGQVDRFNGRLVLFVEDVR